MDNLLRKENTLIKMCVPGLERLECLLTIQHFRNKELVCRAHQADGPLVCEVWLDPRSLVLMRFTVSETDLDRAGRSLT